MRNFVSLIPDDAWGPYHCRGRPGEAHELLKPSSPPAKPIDPHQWSAALAALAPGPPPAGIDPGWWRTLLADALWIVGSHAETAAALGWSASDLFGIRPNLGPGSGGVADRLDGARRLAFTATVAHWESEELEGWLWRRSLTPKPLLWEL
jgi:hypothetical protein